MWGWTGNYFKAMSWNSQNGGTQAMKKRIGILTSGGDCPGLNAAIRGVGKAVERCFGMDALGFRDGFRGLMENRYIELGSRELSGILTLGGTILGTSRDKPHRMLIDGKMVDMTDLIVKNYHKNKLEALVCLGGGGTQKNALYLAQQGLNILTLPKTIDNDVVLTDVSFGFDTALGIATDAIDRLHSTASSHHRIIVVEIMGHNAGWLALGSGLAGGADVILIPEIPYDLKSITLALKERRREGKRFSIIAVAEGAVPKEALKKANPKKDGKKGGKKSDKMEGEFSKLQLQYAESTLRLTEQIEELAGLETRVTILGYLQRGGTPSAADRLLATRLGTACADLIHDRHYGVMVAARGDGTAAVPLEKVAGKRKTVPLDHSWIQTARHLEICLGD
jgi:ATP-dependent phosphofructokinase / diphosphate-dependent phosphofructokinase